MKRYLLESPVAYRDLHIAYIDDPTYNGSFRDYIQHKYRARLIYDQRNFLHSFVFENDVDYTWFLLTNDTL
jgi:hypothetical protein